MARSRDDQDDRDPPLAREVGNEPPVAKPIPVARPVDQPSPARERSVRLGRKIIITLGVLASLALGSAGISYLRFAANHATLLDRDWEIVCHFNGSNTRHQEVFNGRSVELLHYNQNLRTDRIYQGMRVKASGQVETKGFTSPVALRSKVTVVGEVYSLDVADKRVVLADCVVVERQAAIEAIKQAETAAREAAEGGGKKKKKG